MKMLVSGFIAGIAVATTASAPALSSVGSTTQLKPGQSVSINSGGRQATCQAVVVSGLNTFSCYVGTQDSRARFSTTINKMEVTVSKYNGPVQAVLAHVPHLTGTDAGGALELTCANVQGFHPKRCASAARRREHLVEHHAGRVKPMASPHVVEQEQRQKSENGKKRICHRDDANKRINRSRYRIPDQQQP
jgi:hypothetical protein